MNIEDILVISNRRRAEVEELRAERDALRAALKEALAQNERFDKRYRDAEAEVERLKAAVTEIGAAHIAANVESERLRATEKLDARTIEDAMAKIGELAEENERLLEAARKAWAEVKAALYKGDSEEAIAFMTLDDVLGVHADGTPYTDVSQS